MISQLIHKHCSLIVELSYIISGRLLLLLQITDIISTLAILRVLVLIRVSITRALLLELVLYALEFMVNLVENVYALHAEYHYFIFTFLSVRVVSVDQELVHRAGT